MIADKWQEFGKMAKELLKQQQSELANVYGRLDEIKDDDKKKNAQALYERLNKAIKNSDLDELNAITKEATNLIKT